MLIKETIRISYILYYQKVDKVQKQKRVLRIRIRILIQIHRIHMFLGLLDPDPDLNPSITKQKKLEKPWFLWLLFDFLSLKMMYMYLQEVISKKI